MKPLRFWLLCLLALVSVPASAEVFTCQADGPDASPITMRVINGRLYADVNGTSRRADHGRIVATDPILSSRLEQPLLTDGTGKVRMTWDINRATGRYHMTMYAYNPYKPRPLEIEGEGDCYGLARPADTNANDTAATKGAQKSSDHRKSSDNDDLDAQYEREKRELQDQQDRDQAQRDEEERDRLDQIEAKRRADTERADRERAEAERVRKEEEARLAKERAEAEKAKEAERARVEKERAEAEAKRRAQAQREADEAGLRNGFSGYATTCAGGGKDVLYLQTNRPSKLGCNVRFEARCPGTPSGSGVSFGQANYVGGSCMGLGDNIRIGTMSCPANAVQVSMTSASCQ